MIAASGRFFLVLTPVVLLLIIFFNLSEDIDPDTARARLAVYRHEHSREAWFQVDDTSGHAWKSDTLEEREDVLFDGVHRFVRSSLHSRPKLIFLVLTQDESSWGADSFKPARTFEDFLDMINSTGVNLADASLGIMTSSETEYEHYRNATASTLLYRVTILV